MISSHVPVTGASDKNVGFNVAAVAGVSVSSTADTDIGEVVAGVTFGLAV